MTTVPCGWELHDFPIAYSGYIMTAASALSSMLLSMMLPPVGKGQEVDCEWPCNLSCPGKARHPLDKAFSGLEETLL